MNLPISDLLPATLCWLACTSYTGRERTTRLSCHDAQFADVTPFMRLFLGLSLYLDMKLRTPLITVLLPVRS
jgi:hypothetical protein